MLLYVLMLFFQISNKKRTFLHYKMCSESITLLALWLFQSIFSLNQCFFGLNCLFATHFNTSVENRRRRTLPLISSTFYTHIFCTKFWRQKLQS
jgi:hypothetical protein